MSFPAANGLIRRLISLGAPLAAWALAAHGLNDPRLPAPEVVFARLWLEAVDGPLLFHLWATLLRVGAAFGLAMAIGVALGLWMGRSRTADLWLDGVVMFLLNLPALAVIVLAYLWMGLGEPAAVLAAALNKIPNVAVTVRQGARDLAPDLADMATVFRFSRWSRLRHVTWPQLLPYVLVAARSGLALIWKIVLVVELMGRPNGIGFQMNVMFQLFDVAGLLAYALSFIAVVQAIEHFVFVPLEARHARGR